MQQEKVVDVVKNSAQQQVQKLMVLVWINFAMEINVSIVVVFKDAAKVCVLSSEKAAKQDVSLKCAVGSESAFLANL